MGSAHALRFKAPRNEECLQQTNSKSGIPKRVSSRIWFKWSDWQIGMVKHCSATCLDQGWFMGETFLCLPRIFPPYSSRTSDVLHHKLRPDGDTRQRSDSMCIQGDIWTPEANRAFRIWFLQEVYGRAKWMIALTNRGVDFWIHRGAWWIISQECQA
jgi:hypothetical protein